MLSQLPGKPLQYYDGSIPGFPDTSSGFGFISHVLNAEDIKVPFDKINGQDIISNNGHTFNKFTIYKLSDGINSVLTRVEIKNETTVTLLSDITMIDVENAILVVPKLGSPLKYEGVEDGGYKCSFVKFPNSGIVYGASPKFYAANQSKDLLYAGKTTGQSWIVLMNEQFCCLLQQNYSGMAGVIIEVFSDHVVVFDFDNRGVLGLGALDNVSLYNMACYSIVGNRLATPPSSSQKSSVLFPAIYDISKENFVSNYLFASTAAPVIKGLKDFVFSNESKFLTFYLFNREDNVFIVNVDGERQ